ncbi:MAG: hypothetical protein COB67_11595 [SAR324 cluster bacterium]|uniref:SSD domain-containing protein n=1 Tax=SAR324 cluster bacterium TaxID=2024889 RepID=A0A2A4STQ7_9DELT|nr:MAG: hypothetical protein COB67_11595 [SAR324 cluster bacterium]
MCITTLVLSSGFFILSFSTMKNIGSFGLLSGFTIVVALLADLLIVPACLSLIYSHESVTRENQASPIGEPHKRETKASDLYG